MDKLKNKCRGAGIIIYRKNNSHYEILGLEALPKFKIQSKGKYDVPKGQIDLGETPLACAYRECYEESNLIPKSIKAGPFIHGNIWLWLAECNETPKLKRNKATGEYEHLSYDWLLPGEIIKNCLDYLRPSLIWARSILENEN
jgi:8-oxo-dGTP pyrophosphatase MutT (NUDIX family)